ncbi:hypothetical protein F4861DRAFT_540734 [Xylaria intraflava]|nr:hypothetical protein F4861DRAFT_540734 [Xylaria intraflava]
MTAKQISPLRRAWYQWKALRLPWRKRFLVGLDLQGNTYWEFRLARGDVPATAATPFRRIVHYPRSTHYSDITVPPAWHQWLRYQRDAPPTIQEQSAEATRQERIKVLAAEADARWEAKPSLLDMPARSGPAPTAPREAGGRDQRGDGTTAKQTDTHTHTQTQTPHQDDPWKRAAQRGAPGETWQPEAWTPAPTKNQKSSK